MLGQEAGGARLGPRRGRLRLRTLMVAAALAALGTLMAAGSASADYWPHAGDDSPAVVQT